MNPRFQCFVTMTHCHLPFLVLLSVMFLVRKCLSELPYQLFREEACNRCAEKAFEESANTAINKIPRDNYILKVFALYNQVLKLFF